MEQKVEMDDKEECTFEDVEDLLRKAYDILAEGNGDSELMSLIEGALSLCAANGL